MRRKLNGRLTQARVDRKWTPEDVADRIDIPAKRIRRIENGTGLATSEEKAKLCALFGLDMEALGFLSRGKIMQKRRTEFLKEKRENMSRTDRILGASSKGSSGVQNIRNRKGGRARKSRRG